MQVVNLIPFNPIGSLSRYRTSDDEKVVKFQRILRGSYNIRTTIRKQMGQDISGACGQLVVKKSSCRSDILTDIEDLRIWFFRSDHLNYKCHCQLYPNETSIDLEIICVILYLSQFKVGCHGVPILFCFWQFVDQYSRQLTLLLRILHVFVVCIRWMTIMASICQKWGEWHGPLITKGFAIYCHT